MNIFTGKVMVAIFTVLLERISVSTKPIVANVEKIRGLCKILANIMITTIHMNDYSWGFSKMVIKGKKSFEQDFCPNLIIFTGIASKYIFNKNEKKTKSC